MDFASQHAPSSCVFDLVQLISRPCVSPSLAMKLATPWKRCSSFRSKLQECEGQEGCGCRRFCCHHRPEERRQRLGEVHPEGACPDKAPSGRLCAAGGPARRLRAFLKGGTPEPRANERVLFLESVHRALGFPLHDFVCGLMYAYGMQIHDLTLMPYFTLLHS